MRRAWPLASSVTRATTVLPTKNVTVPVGVPVPDGSRTVAVNVTACPTLAGLADANRAVVVALRVVGRVHLLGEGLRAAHEVRVAAVDRGDGVAARGREAGRERRRAAGPDRDGPQDHVAVLERDRAGRRSGPRGDGGHRGGEGHGLAGDGRVDRRPQGDRGRRAVDGHGHGRRGAVGEAAGARRRRPSARGCRRPATPGGWPGRRRRAARSRAPCCRRGR